MKVYYTVGCGNGDITLWEVAMREKLISKPFKIWDISTCSMAFQVLLPLHDSLITVLKSVHEG